MIPMAAISWDFSSASESSVRTSDSFRSLFQSSVSEQRMLTLGVDYVSIYRCHARDYKSEGISGPTGKPRHTFIWQHVGSAGCQDDGTKGCGGTVHECN